MKNKLVAMIPARMGSVRFKKKNLAMIEDHPMIYYVIEETKKSESFDRIVINSEDDAFEAIAKKYGVEFYKRPEALGSSTTKSDDVVYDFIKKNPSTHIAWINPVSPLQSGEEIKKVVDHFVKNDLDSLITAIEEKVHCLYDGVPLNFNFNDKFAQTQDLKPVMRFVYSVMMWKNETFVRAYERDGVAMMCGKFEAFSVDKLAGLIVKTQRDFEICQMLLAGRNNLKDKELQYAPEAKEKL